MKVLITGATGFLGEWIVKESVARGYEVHILVRKTSDLEKIKNLPITTHTGDVTDLESINLACKNMDAVFHLAGLISYKKSAKESMYAVNVGGTKSVLSACIKNNIRTLVYLSSVTAIGSSFKPVPLNEESSYNIANLHLGYFDTKHEAENLVMAAYKEGTIDPVILNPSTIYGAGDATKSSRKIQMQVAKGKFPFYTPGGVNVVHIEDVVKGFFLAFDKKIFGERIILAGDNLTIKTLFRIIAEASGVTPPSILLPKLLLRGIGLIGDSFEALHLKGPIGSETAWTSSLYHWFDNTKAKQQLGIDFQPSTEAIKQSVTWAKENGFI
ncbi:MAG: NAD-dependent epimerase/dehydratase family protein [Bdellovibrionales bacterium]|nr:NAD-dependent epimerase/dehydratase family protein [Bdellovibrionales bacterium]